MLKFIIGVLILLYNISYLSAQIFKKNPSWKEDFNQGNIPDASYWSYVLGMRGKELEYYTNSRENVHIKSGKLIIKAIEKQKGNALCTSGRIHTQGKVSFLYGKLEIKAKCPTGKGIWPAIWMIPEKWSLPFGEIDIMEYIDCWKAKKYQINIHIETNKNGEKNRKTYPKMVEANVNQYHIYTLEWYKDKLKFFLDHKLCYEFNKEIGKPWPFNKPYYLILNVAYGAWGGTCGIDNSSFPHEMKVDWIKYYKLIEQ
ncbi:glycoside hydrolase family 16 protein [Phocaeicola coprocola]|nr:glycoside hydrolase family 16 protein [Phocaeicola coprocola]MBM6902464.1 glycoside hydrolase family 16 protein [Phocaeicola coprocola]